MFVKMCVSMFVSAVFVFVNMCELVCCVECMDFTRSYVSKAHVDFTAFVHL